MIGARDDLVLLTTSDEAEKSPDVMEHHIAETRAHLGETLDELGHRLAPRYFLEKVMDMARDTIARDSRSIGDVLRDYPVPLALIGAGFGWLLLSKSGLARDEAAQRYSREARHKVAGAVDATSDYAGGVAGQVRHMADSAADDAGPYGHARVKTGSLEAGASMAGDDASRSDDPGLVQRAADAATGVAEQAKKAGVEAWRAARDYAGTAGERAGRVGEYGRHALASAGDYTGQAGEQVARVKVRLAQVIEDYPLAVGALGFLAGAIVAASMPATLTEDELIGSASEDLRRQTETAGREVLGRAKVVAATAAEAAGEAARRVLDTTTDAIRAEADEAFGGVTTTSGDRPNDKV